MLELFIHQFQGMSFGEELYTIAFTVFFVGGAVCCFVRKDKPTLVRPTMPSRHPRRF